MGLSLFIESKSVVQIQRERYPQMLQAFRGALNRGYGPYCQRHTAIVERFLPERIISWFGDINWPARSPDLTAPDLLLWGDTWAARQVN